MSKVRDISNLSNVIRTDASGNVSFVSGSTTLATINTSGQLSGSSPVLSSSYALNATSASYAVSASNATNAVTASFANAFTVANTLTATTLVVQTVSSSVIYSSGSNVFGNNIANTQVFTGSVYINGSNNTLNYVPKITGSGLLINSLIQDNGVSQIGVGILSGWVYSGLKAIQVNTATMYGYGGTAGFASNVYFSSSFKYITNGGGGYIENNNAGDWSFLTAPSGNEGSVATLTTKMYISSSGNVGISTTTPLDRLDVAGTIRATVNTSYFTTFGYIGGTQIRMVSPIGETADNMVFKIDGASSGTAGNQFIFQTQAGNTTPVTTLWISKLGDVNIGTTTSTKYQVLNLTNDANTAGAAIGLARSAGQFITNAGAGDLIIGNATGKNILFGNTGAGTTEYMRISSGGDILIAGGNTTGQSSVTTMTALRFPNQYSTGYTDASVKLFLFNSGATIQGFTAGPGYDLQYHSSGDNSAGRHVWFVGNTEVLRVQSTSGNVTIRGSLSKGSGSFRIKHPLTSKKNTHQLVHSFIEGPQADLIYSGGVTLVDGKATINIDEAATMTEGTFEALNRNIRVFTSNETSWDNVRGKVVGNILTIECQNTESTDKVSWLVIGERQDEHMMDTEWTDSNGKVIVEPLIPVDIKVESYN
jgi:hypothetical protein